MKAAWDRSEEYSQRRYLRQDNNPHLKDPLAALAKALECLENPHKGWHLVSQLSLLTFVVAMAFSIAGANMLQNMRKGPYWDGVWPYLDPWDVVRKHPSVWNVPRKYGPHGEIFFLHHQEGALCSYRVQGLCFAWSTPHGSRRWIWVLLVLWCLFRWSWEGSQGSVVQSTLCGKQKFLALEMRAQWVTSTTMSAGLLKSSGRLGQAMWRRSFSRTGSLGE